MKHSLEAPPALDDAISIYSTFWSGMNLNSSTFKGRKITFDGSLRDFEALYYCVYEVGFPEDQYFYASLIWAQAVVNNTEARWLEPIANNIAIGGPDEDFPKLVFFPHTRLLEIVEGSYTQFDTFAMLTDHFLFQAVLSGYSEREIPRLHELSFSQEYGSFYEPYSSFDGLATTGRLLKSQRRKSNKARHSNSR